MSRLLQEGSVPLPTSTICSNCSADTQGDDLCPCCFTSVIQQEKRFTLESPALSAPAASHSLSVAKATPDLSKVAFKPSSAMSRFLHKIKGPTASLAVSLVIVGAAGYYWHTWQMGRAGRAAHSAELAYEKSEFDKSLELWDDAFDSYRFAFSKGGQVDALIHGSESNLRLAHFPEALRQAERARKLREDSDTRAAVDAVHLAWGKHHLDQAQDYLSNGAEDDAAKHAVNAIDELKLGSAKNPEMARAYRAAARACAEKFDFDHADMYMKTSLELTGKDRLNSQASADIADLRTLYALAQKEKARRERYIPDKKIDLIAVAKSIRANRVDNSSAYSGYSGYGYSGGSATLSRSRSYSSTPSYSSYNRPRVVEARTDYPKADYPKATSSYSDPNYYSGSAGGYRPSSTYSAPVNTYVAFSSYSRRPKTSSGPSYPTARPKLPTYPSYSGQTSTGSYDSSRVGAGSNRYR